MALEKTANTIWRDYVTDGVPASGKHKPVKADIREHQTFLESIIAAGTLSDAVWKDTKANLDGDLAHDADTIGVVYDDSTASNNGLYKKSGASGSGSWTQITTFLPGYQFVTATDDGSSAANAMTMDTSPTLPSGDAVALVSLIVPVTNTSATVTVAFDGGSALAVKTASGSNPAIGGLVANTPLLGVVVGSEFRMRSDQAAAAIQTAAENAQAYAEEWANKAEDSLVSSAAGGDQVDDYSALHWAKKAEAASPSAFPNTRTDLASLSTTAYLDAFLTEDGYEGHFEQVDKSSYTSLISADTVGGEIKVSTDDTSKAWLRTRKYGNLFKTSEFGGDIAVAMAVAAERHTKATVEINTVGTLSPSAGLVVLDGVDLVGLGREKTTLDFSALAAGSLVQQGVTSAPFGILVAGGGLTDVGVAFTDISVGDAHIDFSASHGLSVGDILTLVMTPDGSFGVWNSGSGSYDIYNSRTGYRWRQTVYVVGVDGNTVYLSARAIANFVDAASGQGATTIYKQAQRSGRFGGFTIDFSGSSAANCGGIRFEQVDNCEVDDLGAEGFYYSGIVFNQCFDMYPERLHARAGIRSTFPDSLSPGGVDYPVLIASSTDVECRDIFASGNWCGTDFGGFGTATGNGISYRCSYKRGTLMSTYTGRTAGMHGNVHTCGYDGMDVHGAVSLSGYNTYGTNCVVDMRDKNDYAGIGMGENFGGYRDISGTTVKSDKDAGTNSEAAIYVYETDYLTDELVLRGTSIDLQCPSETKGLLAYQRSTTHGVSADLHFKNAVLDGSASYLAGFSLAVGSVVAKFNKIAVDEGLPSGVPYGKFFSGYTASRYGYPEQTKTMTCSYGGLNAALSSVWTFDHEYPVVPRFAVQPPPPDTSTGPSVIAQASASSYPSTTDLRVSLFKSDDTVWPGSGSQDIEVSVKL